MTVAGGIIMKRTLVVFVLLATATAFAQDNKNPVTSVVKEILPRQQKNLVAAVEEMPADRFGYKPTPQQMSFAHLVACRRVTITRALASKLSWPMAAKSCSPSNSILT